MFFQSQKAFGIDISDYSVEVLELKKVGITSLTVRSYARSVLERGIVENGVIRDTGRLSSVIHETIERAIPYVPSTKLVIASLPESQTYIHVFFAPQGLRKGELRELVHREASETFPFEAEEIFFDFSRGSRSEYHEEILFAATPQAISLSYETLFRGIGLELIALDLESASTARTIVRDQKKETPFLVIDIGSRTTNFTLADRNGFIRYSLTLPVAGAHMTHAISEALQVPFESAEHLKKRIGLNPSYQEGRMALILQKILGEIIKETEQVLGFYKERYGEEIRDIFLVGGGSLLPQFENYISTNTGREAHIFRPREIPNEFIQSLTGGEDPVFFTNVMGLALRGLEVNPEMAGINLLSQNRGENDKSGRYQEYFARFFRR